MSGRHEEWSRRRRQHTAVMCTAHTNTQHTGKRILDAFAIYFLVDRILQINLQSTVTVSLVQWAQCNRASALGSYKSG